MATVSIRINGHSYQVGCEDGQERHLQAMAQLVEKRVRHFRSLGFTNDNHLLALVALVMADEIEDLSQRVLPEATTAALQEAEYMRTRHDFTQSRLADLAERAESLATMIEQEYNEGAELPDASGMSSPGPISTS
ncbi:cell division protein ZapA [Acetobacter sp. DsW_059]|nr:cell division protein ZapA [Acetobacter sp. DsW_059]